MTLDALLLVIACGIGIGLPLAKLLATMGFIDWRPTRRDQNAWTLLCLACIAAIAWRLAHGSADPVQP